MKSAFISRLSVSFFGCYILLSTLLGLFGVREVRNSHQPFLSIYFWKLVVKKLEYSQ